VRSSCSAWASSAGGASENVRSTAATPTTAPAPAAAASATGSAAGRAARASAV